MLERLILGLSLACTGVGLSLVRNVSPLTNEQTITDSPKGLSREEREDILFESKLRDNLEFEEHQGGKFPTMSLLQKTPDGKKEKMTFLADECHKTRMTYQSLKDSFASMVLLAGAPKAGTTFLHGCMTAAFHPERVCGSAGKNAENWQPDTCRGSRFLLSQKRPWLGGNDVEKAAPNIAVSVLKESFYWDKHYDGNGIESYLGPPVPLSLWAGKVQYVQKMDAACHNARDRAEKLGKADCSCLDIKYRETKMPRALTPPRVGKSRFVEGTPNLLGHPKSAMRLAKELGDDVHRVPVILNLRDPEERFFSEYNMFLWWYTHNGNFSQILDNQIRNFEKCRGEVFDHLNLRRVEKATQQTYEQLDKAGLQLLLEKCFRGEAMDLLGNSAYGLSMQNWINHGFRPSQFFVISQKTMNAMNKNNRQQDYLKPLSEFLDLELPEGDLPTACTKHVTPFMASGAASGDKLSAEEYKILQGEIPTKTSDSKLKTAFRIAQKKHGMYAQDRQRLQEFYKPLNSYLKQRLTQWKAEGMTIFADRESESFFP